MREYSRTHTLIANLPYAAMVILGTLLVGLAFDGLPARALAGTAYLAYGIAGAVWIMVFVCPYCHYYGTRGCPCGYGIISARIARKGEEECFARKFRRHIPVIVPLWLLPLGCGIWGLSRGYSGALAALVGAFVVNSYVLLPLVSRRHACTECPQKETCPWMGRSASP